MRPDRWPPLLSAFSAIWTAWLGGFGKALGAAVGPAFFRDLVEFGLGALDLSEGGNFLTRVERAFDQAPTDADQGPEQRQIINLIGEVAGADDGRARSRQLRQIGRVRRPL